MARFGAGPSGTILFMCVDSCVSHKDAYCLHRNCKGNVLLTFGKQYKLTNTNADWNLKQKQPFSEQKNTAAQKLFFKENSAPIGSIFFFKFSFCHFHAYKSSTACNYPSSMPMHPLNSAYFTKED